jgi:ankyrin repeat protein
MRRPSKSALFEAAKTWDAAGVKALIEASPELIRAVSPKGRTALHLACGVKPGSGALGEANGLETVTALLDGGADLEFAAPGEKDEEDFRATPLWFAVARGENPALVRFLLERGADASFSLWAVVWRDDEATCRELLKSRPRLNLLAHGETPIFYAARLKRLKTLNLLIDAGADPGIADRKGRDAADIARARSLPKLVVDRLDAARRASKS